MIKFWHEVSRSAVLVGLGVSLLGGKPTAQEPTARSARTAPDRTPWSADDLISPAELAKTLDEATRPTIVHVGFRALYRPGHIPGAVFHGPASEAAGLDELRRWASGRQRSQRLVIYCGCCPFDQCPNVAPAFKMLRELGFADVRVLDLPTSFAADWVEKGYPVSRK